MTNANTAKPTWKWPLRFTIRTVLIVIALLSVLFSWLGARYHQALYRKHVLSRLREFADVRPGRDYKITFDCIGSSGLSPARNWWSSPRLPFPNKDIFGVETYDTAGVELNGLITPYMISEVKTLANVSVIQMGDGCNFENGALSRLEGMTTLLHLDFFGSYITDDNCSEIPFLANLESLSFGYTKVTDASARHWQRFPQLKTLLLTETAVTDKGVEEIGKILTLQALDLARAPISDSGVKNLTNLSRLEVLILCGTNITDQAIESFAQLKSLKRLSLDATVVTPAGVKRLNTLLPNCSISHQQ